MKPYSMDLRDKVLTAYDRKQGSQRVLADRFGIAPATVQNWLRRRRQTGAAEPRTAPGGTPKLDAEAQSKLRAIITADTDGALHEWAGALCEHTGVRLHESTVWRYAGRFGLTRKKRRPAPRSASVAT